MFTRLLSCRIACCCYVRVCFYGICCSVWFGCGVGLCVLLFSFVCCCVGLLLLCSHICCCVGLYCCYVHICLLSVGEV